MASFECGIHLRRSSLARFGVIEISVGELISAHPGESEFQSMLDIDNAEKIDTAVSTAAIMILHTRYE